MVVDLNIMLEAGAASVTAIGGIYGVARRIVTSSKRKKELYRQEILDRAKEEADRIREALEDKIRTLEIEFENQKQSVEKDFEHFKEVHGAEVRVLGEKIESLRADLAAQHSSLVALLTKLVSDR